MQLNLSHHCRRATRRGDTIVETMFAFAIFGLIAIVNIQIIQKGTRLNQAALEVSLAREQMTAQVESLRLINTAYINEYVAHRGDISGLITENNTASRLWDDIIKQKIIPNSIKSLDEIAGSECSIPANAFVLDYRNQGLPQIKKTGLVPALIYPRVTYRNSTDSSDIDDKNDIKKETNYVYQSADGIWVEAVEGAGKYFDFLIRTCWKSPASSVPTTLETMVRLYVP